MYVYLLFVLIGILLFLLFNNKNKFSISFQDNIDSSQSGESDEDDGQQNTVPQIAAAVGQAHDSDKITPDDWMVPGFPGGGWTMRGIVVTSCAAAVGLLGAGAVALRRGRNPRQQLPQSDIETGDP